jgi:LysR family nitrogen assimilation transcriptional regulator
VHRGFAIVINFFRMRRYRNFVTIVDAGSISKAANLLHIAQPALTQQIHALEADLGVKLLERNSKGVVPTDAGRLFFDRAQMLLRMAGSIRQDVAYLDKHPSGPVWIGIPTSTAILLAVPLVEAVRRAYPDIRLSVLTGVSGSLEERLHAGRLDMAILSQAARPGLHFEWIYEEALYLVTPADLAVEDPFPLSSIDQVSLILPSATLGVRSLLDTAFARAGVVPRVVAEVDGSIPTTNALVRRGVGCSIVPWATIAEDVARGDVKGIRLTPLIWRSSALCRAVVPPLPRAAAAVFGLVKQVIRAQAGALTPTGSLRLKD